MNRYINTITEKLSNLWPWKNIANENPGLTAEQKLNLSIRRYELLIFKLQSLLVWEDNVISTIFVIGCNLLFGLIVTWQFRFYSIASLTILFVFVYNIWIEEIWPEIRLPPQDPPDSEDWTPVHPSVLSTEEISHYVNNSRNYFKHLYKNACKLRREQPSVFFTVCCGILFVSLFLGRTISGVWILFILLNSILLLPGLFLYILPKETLTQLSEFINNICAIFTTQPEGTNNLAPEAEFLPEDNPETIALLSLTLKHAGITHNPDDDDLVSLLPNIDSIIPDIHESSACNSLIPGLGFMPSHDDDSLDSVPVVDEEEFIKKEPALESNEGIRFRKHHFKKSDSSASSTSSSNAVDDDFGHGLNFTDITKSKDDDDTKPLIDFDFLASASNMAQSIAGTVGNLLSQSNATATTSSSNINRRSSSDDDDFEIINQDDLPKFP